MATTESRDKYLSLGRCVIGAAVLAALVSPARCLGVIPVLLEKVGENRTVLIRGAVRLNHMMLNGRPERSGTSTASPAAPPTEYLNSRPGTAYVGSKACAKCHRDIYEQYIQTNMARAMSLPMPLVESGKLPVPVTTYDKKLNRYFQVFTDASGLYESVYRVDKDGKTVYRETEKISYTMGTGRNGIGLLVRRGNYLFQAPLAFYPRDKTWGLSPGYESFDVGFTRPITAECVICHSGLPRPLLAGIGLYENPPFRELGIGCENCHGPGQLHAEQREKGLPFEGVDATIVNPARLPAGLTNDICMFCHEAGDARVPKPGKSPLDFRPGTPLDNTLAVLDVFPNRDAGPGVPLVGYYLHMQLSRCYRQSGDRLRCITCHNPHFQPPASKTAAYYREKCLQCHTDKSCTQSLVSRLRSNPPDDCASCHMTKQPAANFAHTVVTDHRIVARPGEPYPEAAPPKSEQNTNGLIHINGAPHEEASSLTAVVLLQAYAQLLLSHPENANYQEQYRALLHKLAETEPNEAIVLRFLAGAEAQKRTPDAWERGISYMQRAIRLDPSHASDRFWLAQMLGHSGRPLEAAQELEKAIAAEPYNPEYYMYLAACYVSGGRHREGMEAINRALQLFPDNEDMRIVLDKVRRPALNQ